LEYTALQEISLDKPTGDDRQLLKRIAGGDRQALTELYARYQRLLFNYLLQLTPDYGLAEELFQDTLVAVWKSASSFGGRSSVQTWLIGVARRQAHNTLRQRKISLVNESELEGLADVGPEAEDFTLASIARDELVEAFKQLGSVHRGVLVLILVQELSYEETAAALNVPVGTVKSRLSNAKRLLRALLVTREGAGR